LDAERRHHQQGPDQQQCAVVEWQAQGQRIAEYLPVARYGVADRERVGEHARVRADEQQTRDEWAEG
jgi:hypothetical protein